MNSLKVLFLSFVLLFAFGLVLAQETPPAEVNEAVNLDENIQPEDLGVSEPNLLPDNPLYFLKNWARGIQQVLTFNPVKKAELRMKFANEKLMEVKKTAQKTQDPEKIKKAAENYQQEIEKIKNQVEKIKETAKENPQVESFLDKFIHQQTLHEKLLQKLETQVPPEAFEKIKEAREEHLERFKDVMLKLEDRKEKITEKLDKILEEQKGSQFKEFKNLEVLKNLEEKVPEEAKEAIQKAEENALKRLQGDLEKMSPENQEEFKEYLEKISGEKEKHLEIMEKIKSESPELKENLEKVKERIKEKIKEKKGEPVACAQVITYCIDPSTGECAVYPDACSTPKPCQSCSILPK
jgi:DNA repair exonuclease SbcCD ATPase subunit